MYSDHRKQLEVFEVFHQLTSIVTNSSPNDIQEGNSPESQTHETNLQEVTQEIQQLHKGTTIQQT